MAYEYRVFMVNHGEELTFLHDAEEKLRDGVIILQDAGGTELHGRRITIYSVLTHPSEGRPAIGVWPSLAS